MQSWSDIALPAVPGSGPPLRLFDTADRQVRPLTPGPTATMYVCGITPYDATHLGHAATYLTFDLVNRMLRDAGHDVHYVQNITDVDDPLFERADRDGVDWRDLGDREIELFRADMAALRVVPPRDYIGAVESIGEVVELVDKLLASGAAYVVDDAEYPDVYFRYDATEQFGYESGYSPSAAAIRAGRANATRWMRCCGASLDRASPRGRLRSAADVPAGTSSARRSRSTGSARSSTSRAAAAT